MSSVGRSSRVGGTRGALGLVLAALAVASLLLGGGCAILPGGTGAGGRVVADTARYPISLSLSTRDRDGSVVGPERQERVAAFETEGRFWATLYSLVPLARTLDISDAVNERVDQVRGDAIVNLRVTVSPHALNSFIPLTALPVWPGAADVLITGDVIRVLPRPTSVTRTATATPSVSAAATAARAATATPAAMTEAAGAVGVIERVDPVRGGFIVELAPGEVVASGQLLEVMRGGRHVAWLRAGKTYEKTGALSTSPAYSEPLTAYRVGDVAHRAGPAPTARAVGDVGTVERIDAGRNAVSVRLTAGAHAGAGDLLEVMRGQQRVAWLRTDEVREKDSALVASPAYSEPVATFRVGDRVRAARR